MPYSLTAYSVPGAYVTENTIGVIPAGLATHSAAYMLGYSNKSGAPKNVASFVTSPDDFFNQFGVSASTNSVALFFNQRSGAGLWFINVESKATRLITVDAPLGVGEDYVLTVDGFALTYESLTGDSPTAIATALVNKVNTEASHIVTAVLGSAGTFTLRFKTGLVTTGTSNLEIGAVSAAPSYPTVADVSEAMQAALEPDMPQGFICAPEFFQSWEVQSDRVALQSNMESLVSDPGFYWISVVDCGEDVATQTTGAGAVNLALAERNLMASPKGHSAYYFPYWKDLKDNLVPMSASVIGVALRRYRNEGFREPPAGTPYPVYGVKDVSFPVTSPIQGQLNPKGINCGRRLPAGRGLVVYGARSLSVSPYYRFITTRVIMNVLAGSLRGAFDELIFSTVDGLGALFSRLKQTATAILEAMRLGGALYGATPDQAYLVICDQTNNLAVDLESGKVNLDILAKPSPLMEVLAINLFRASIGTVLAEVGATGDTNEIQQPEAPPTQSGNSQAP